MWGTIQYNEKLSIAMFTYIKRKQQNLVRIVVPYVAEPTEWYFSHPSTERKQEEGPEFPAMSSNLVRTVQTIATYSILQLHIYF